MRLVNVSFTSHNNHFIFMMKTLKIYSNSNFQLYSIVLLAIVTLLYIRFLELTHLMTESLYPLTNISHFTTHSPWQPPFNSVSKIFLLVKMFLDSTCKWNIYVQYLSFSDWAECLQGYHKWQGFIFVCVWLNNILWFLCTCIKYIFKNPFIHCWTLRQFPYLGFYEQCWNEYGSAGISYSDFIIFGYSPRSWIGGT